MMLKVQFLFLKERKNPTGFEISLLEMKSTALCVAALEVLFIGCYENESALGALERNRGAGYVCDDSV